MKHVLVTFFLLAVTVSGAAYCWCQPEDYSFYTKIGSGVSCSQCANVCAPTSTWAPAIQGYNAKLGHCPIASLSIGCELWDVLDLEFDIANRSIFEYRKFQTPTTGGGFLHQKI